MVCPTPHVTEQLIQSDQSEYTHWHAVPEHADISEQMHSYWKQFLRVPFF